jgi:lipopolysaccharide export system permease protein
MRFKKLDLYLLREFLSPLALMALGLASLVTLVQAVDSLPSFRDFHAPLYLIFLYHLCKLPLLLTYVMPVAVMLSTLVALGGLARTGEIAAMQSGGVSVLRLARPLLAAGLVIWALLFSISEWLVPYATDRSLYIQKVLIQHRPGIWGAVARERVAMNLAGDRQAYIEHWDGEKDVMIGVTALRNDQGRLVERVDAAQARYEDGHWFLLDGVARRFDAMGLEASAESFTRQAWDIPEQPSDFLVESNQREEDLLQLSVAQLSKIIRILKLTGADYQRELVCLHVRISYPFSCFVLALLGVSLPFLFPTGRRAVVGAAIGLLVSLCSGMIYLVCIQVGLSLGKSGVLPALPAAWIGNLFFLGLGLFALRKATR